MYPPPGSMALTTAVPAEFAGGVRNRSSSEPRSLSGTQQF